MRVCGRAEVQRSGCSGPARVGRELTGRRPPSARPPGRGRGCAQPLARADPLQRPKVVGLQRGGLPTAAPRASPLCPAATGSLAERVPGVGTRSARPGGGARLHLGGPGACEGRGPAPRRAPYPLLPAPTGPSCRPSTSRRTLVARGGPQPHAARAFALTTFQPGLALGARPRVTVILTPGV